MNDAANRVPSSLTKGLSHEVLNQAMPLEHLNLFRGDQVLGDTFKRFAGNTDDTLLASYGALAGGPLMALGEQANQSPPRLQTHDRFGHRIDRVEFHPAYHELMGAGIGHSIHALPWINDVQHGHLRRAVLHMMHSQAEAGTGCPITMTFACVPAIRSTTSVAENWLPGILSSDYDPSDLPAAEKQGLTIGMAMTEKQGGSDVRANTTVATPLGAQGPGELYRLVGHKWFCSAPMSDAFLVLAHCPAGLSCFLLPRWMPDGKRNPMHLMRLKDKLGNRSNASSEVEFHGADAWMLGEPGRGVRTIIDMVALTRSDCMIGSSALMRQASHQALYHAARRHAFGKALIQQPLMRSVLLDISMEAEAAMALSLDLNHRMDLADHDSEQQTLLRIAVAVGKYWVCKRAAGQITEAQECLGGNGYVEESILPRLYREAPVNAIWEGSGNIQCLDALRALEREPRCLDALHQHLQPLLECNTTARAAMSDCHKLLGSTKEQLLPQARRACEQLALLLQARSLMQTQSPVLELFIDHRLGAHRCLNYGGLGNCDTAQSLLDRAMPNPEVAP
jgi:putative acyl-CoA dehydrogenase